MKNLIENVAIRFTIAVFLLIAFLLASCAKKEPEADFRPLQMHWVLAEGEDDSLMPTGAGLYRRRTELQGHLWS